MKTLVIQRNEVQERIWLKGFNTQYFRFDNEWQITGTVEGVNNQGKKYSRTITTPLNILAGCHWPRSGVIAIQVEQESPITIDFGIGTCDPLVTITKDGVSKEVNLLKRN
jgi:hypothetical protein